MTENLRREINNPDLPMLTVQLNRLTDVGNLSLDKGWGMVREAQRKAALEMERVYVIPTTDCGLSDQIHNSSHANILIGERIAKTALYRIYGKGRAYVAPNIKQAQ